MRRISRQYASWLPAALVCASWSLRWWSARGEHEASKAPLRQGKPTSTRCRRRQQHQQRRQRRRPPCPEQQLADAVLGGSSREFFDEDEVEALQAAAADTSHPGALLQLLQEYGSRMLSLRDDNDGASQFGDGNDDDALSVSAVGSSLWGDGADDALQDLMQGSRLPTEHPWARHTRSPAAAQEQVLGQHQQQFGQQPGTAVAAAAAAAEQDADGDSSEGSSWYSAAYVEDSHLGLRASDSADALHVEALRAAAARGASLSVEQLQRLLPVQQHLGGGGWAHSYPPRLDEAVDTAPADTAEAAGLSGAAAAGLSGAAAGLAPSSAGSLAPSGADVFDGFEPQFDYEFEPELDAWDFDPGYEPGWDNPGFDFGSDGGGGGDDGVALDDGREELSF